MQRNHRVKVVGHDYPGVQFIHDAVTLDESIDKEASNFRVFQPAISVPVVQPLVPKGGESLMKLMLRFFVQRLYLFDGFDAPIPKPSLPVLFPLPQLFLGH